MQDMQQYITGNKINITLLRKMNDLPYVFLPLFSELKISYEENLKVHPSWEEDLPETHMIKEELEHAFGNNKKYQLYYEIMKQSAYLVNRDLWIKVAELLIYEYGS